MKKNFPIQQVFEHYPRPASPSGIFQFCPLCGRSLSQSPVAPLQPTCLACGFVQYRNPAPAVSILIADHDHVLLGKRRGEPGKGTWALPSGYIAFDEDFLTAAVRETKEETGLDVAIQAILNVCSSFVTPRYHFLGIYVTAVVCGGTAAASDDLEALTWHPLAAPLPAMGFAEDQAAIALYTAGFAGIPVSPGAKTT